MIKKNRKCDYCENPHLAHGLCRRHYQRWYKYGDPLHVRTPKVSVTPCTVDGCTRMSKTVGMCMLHYNRKREGKPVEDPIRDYWKRPAPGFKTCRVCLEDLPLDRFHVRYNQRGNGPYPASRCKACHYALCRRRLLAIRAKAAGEVNV